MVSFIFIITDEKNFDEREIETENNETKKNGDTRATRGDQTRKQGDRHCPTWEIRLWRLYDIIIKLRWRHRFPWLSFFLSLSLFVPLSAPIIHRSRHIL